MNSFDIPEWLTNLTGESIVAFILFLARWLTAEGTPGWVALGLVIALAVLSFWYEIVTRRFVGAVRLVRAILRVEGAGKITRDRLVDIDGKFGQARARGAFFRRLENAWREFNETALPPAADSGVLRNTVRPDVFFNREDLGLEAGMWRQVPALFVSIGLLLTFLGREFFVRKAIGWALRDYARTDPGEVRRYVAANGSRLSSLTCREALKNLA